MVGPSVQWARVVVKAHRRRALMTTVAAGVLGGVPLLDEIAFLVLPGPGFVRVAAGLAVLAKRFEWACKPLDFAKGEAQARRGGSGAQPIVGGIGRGWCVQPDRCRCARVGWRLACVVAHAHGHRADPEQSGADRRHRVFQKETLTGSSQTRAARISVLIGLGCAGSPSARSGRSRRSRAGLSGVG